MKNCNEVITHFALRITHCLLIIFLLSFGTCAAQDNQDNQAELDAAEIRLTCAVCSLGAYSGDESFLLRSMLAARGWQIEKLSKKNNLADAKAYLAAKGDVKILAIAGTESLKDVEVDFRAGRVPLDDGIPLDEKEKHAGDKIFVHRGFRDYADVVLSDGLFERLQTSLTKNPDEKLYLTGHSLGGAAANLLAARFTRFSELDGTEWWAQSTSKDDIYCYTFGAIDVLTQRINITDGYENIHNIYNFLDSFNCVGGHALGGLNVSSPVSLFGHTDLFLYDFTLENLGSMDQDSKKYAEENFNSITKNHNMPTYIQALDLDLVHCRHDLLLEITGNVDVQIKDADGNIMEDFRYRDFHSPLSIDASTFMGSKVIVLLEGNSNYSVHIEGPAFSQIIARVYDTTDFRLLKEETKTTFLFSKTLDISIPQ